MRRTYTEAGKMQLDAETVHFFCRQSGTTPTVSRLSGNSNPSSVRIPVPNSYTLPVVALSVPGYSTGFVRRDRANQRSEFACSAPVGTTVNYYIFDWSPAIPQSLIDASVEKIYDEQGRCVFCDMAFPGFIVKKILPGGGTHTAPAGNKLAIAQGGFGGNHYSSDPLCIVGGVPMPDDSQGCDQYRFNVEGAVYGGSVSSDQRSASGGGVVWDRVTITSSQPPDQDWDIPNDVMIFDVTNIPLGQTFF